MSSATQDPTSQFSVSVSKALAACLRHGHQPTVSVTTAGWVLLEDLLRWPRICKQRTTPGDWLEIARNNAKLRHEMGFRPSDRTYYTHSRTDVFDEDLLSDTRRSHSPKFHNMGRSGIFMMPSVIRVLCLKLCSLRSKVAAEKVGRDLRAAATSTSSPKKTGDKT